MNRSQFISYVENPDKLTGKDSVLLAEVVRDFPYFQTGHLLYAKSLHNENSIHYNNQLKITAAYATDRKVLHRLITKGWEGEIADSKLQIADSVEVEVVKVIKEEVFEGNIKTVVEDVPVVVSEVEIVEVPVVEMVEERVIEKVIERIEEEKRGISDSVEEKKEVVEADEVLEGLEKEMISEAVNSSYEIEILNEEPVFAGKEEFADSKLQIADYEDGKQERVESNFVLNTSSEERKGEDKIVEVDADEMSFVDWLKHVNDGETVLEKVKEEVLSEKNKSEKSVKSGGKLGAFELIEKFIIF